MMALIDAASLLLLLPLLMFSPPALMITPLPLYFCRYAMPPSRRQSAPSIFAAMPTIRHETVRYVAAEAAVLRYRRHGQHCRVMPHFSTLAAEIFAYDAAC